jgi:hypothetical protein
MKIIAAIFFLLCITASIPSKSEEIVPTRPFDLFISLYTRRIAYARKEFETREEYNKRVPAWDSERIFYFPVPLRYGQKNYSYNTDKQKITIFGGSYGSINNSRTEGLGTINSEVIFGESKYYNGENLFGKKVKVESYSKTSVLLCVKNTNELIKKKMWPDTGMSTDEYFSITFDLSIDKAKIISKNLRIIVGVTISDYSSAIEGKSSEDTATIDNPTHVFNFDYGIICTIKKFVVIDITNGSVWKTINIDPKLVPAMQDRANLPNITVFDDDLKPQLIQTIRLKSEEQPSARVSKDQKTVTAENIEPDLSPGILRTPRTSSSGVSSMRERTLPPQNAEVTQISDFKAWMDAFFAKPLPAPKHAENNRGEAAEILSRWRRDWRALRWAAPRR